MIVKNVDCFDNNILHRKLKVKLDQSHLCRGDLKFLERESRSRCTSVIRRDITYDAHPVRGEIQWEVMKKYYKEL
jgi:hypothetical protein